MRGKRYSTVFYQLALFFILAGILTIGILGSYMYSRVSEMVSQELVHSYELLASQYVEAIQEKLAQYETSVSYIAKNTVIIEQLESTELNSSARGNKISGEVYKSLLSDNWNIVYNCMIYSDQEATPVYGKNVSMMSTVVSRERWHAAWQGHIEEWFFYENPVNNRKSMGVLVYPIYQQNLVSLDQKKIGIVKLELDLEKLFSHARTTQNSFQVAVFDGEGKNWYRTDGIEEGEAYKYLKEIQESGWDDGNVRIINGQMICAQYLEDCGLNLIFFFGRDGLDERNREVKGTLIPMILLLTCVYGIICYVFAKRFSRRVNLLVNKFKRVETGDFSVTEPISGRDEIKILDDQFSHMLETINALIRENYIQELEKKETELQNLQLQINPHFLYNTLETISSIAAVQQAFTVCEMCGRLGEIFRYSLGKDYGEFVTVEQELHHVENYVFIQKVRYGDKFEVFYHIDPEVRQCLLLRFILQPVVENAILHGIAPMLGKGTLEITVEKQEETLCVGVTDDGVGMDSARKRELEEHIERQENGQEEKGNIGVRNVHRRIRLSCGEQYGVSIESEPGRGSCFQITFPLRRRGDEECTD